jgi:ABC-type sugar transport system substrate-binding protein
MHEQDEEAKRPEHRLSRRDFVATAGSAVVGLTLAQAGGAFGALDTRTGGKTIGWSQSESGVALWDNIAIPAFTKEIAKKGYKSHVVDAQNNPATESSNMQDLLTLGVSSIVMLPVSGPEAVPMVAQAKAQGVQTIAFNTAIMSSEVAGFVARNNIAVAEFIAKQALKDTGLKGNWVITNGDPANVVAVHQERDDEVGERSVLEELGPLRLRSTGAGRSNQDE